MGTKHLKRKKIFFDLTKTFRSRDLPHTISVFANDKWDKDEIIENQKKIISEFENIMKSIYLQINRIMNNQYLTSGEEYPLAKIFSGGIKIVIPDLQRDYCWGDHAYDKDGNAHELVTRFVSSLIDLFNNDQRVILR